ncbi:flagellin [Geoglobus sp.]
MVRKKGLRRDEKGAIGIEILIVFIAIVLVAAVSAAVLIQTVGFLQQKATATGRETTKEVASGIKVVKVVGYATGVGGTITKLAIYVEPNTGGQDIDLSKVQILMSDGDTMAQLTYDSNAYNNSTSITNVFGTVASNSNTSVTDVWAALDNTEFGLIVLQDSDDSMQTASIPVMNSGDKAILIVNASAVFNGGLDNRVKVSGEVRPELGAPGIIEFTTPPAYTVNVIELQ